MSKRILAVAAVAAFTCGPAMAAPQTLPTLGTTIGGLMGGLHAGAHSVASGVVGNVLPFIRNLPFTQAPGKAPTQPSAKLPGLPA